MPRGKNGKHPDVTVEVVNVTPEMAGDWLAKNPKNRQLRDGRVKRYARAMADGEWKFTGDTIKLTDRDEIVDGQHRLSAVIVADVTVPMLVARGVDKEVFDVIDVGMPRRTQDALFINGHSDAHGLAATLGMLYRYRNFGIFARGRDIDLPTTVQLEELLAAEPEIERFVLPAQRLVRSINMGTGQIATLMYIMAEKDEDDAVDFWEHVKTGADLKKDSPILRLRERLRAKGRLPYNEMGAISIKAWNAYRKGQSMQALSWKQSEPMPKPE